MTFTLPEKLGHPALTLKMNAVGEWRGGADLEELQTGVKVLPGPCLVTLLRLDFLAYANQNIMNCVISSLYFCQSEGVLTSKAFCHTDV